MKPRFCGESFASDINGVCIFGRSSKSPDWLRRAFAANRLTDGLENWTPLPCAVISVGRRDGLSAVFFFFSAAAVGRLTLNHLSPPPERAVSAGERMAATRNQLDIQSDLISISALSGRGLLAAVSQHSLSVNSFSTPIRLPNSPSLPPAPAAFHQPSRKILSPLPVALSPPEPCPLLLPAPARAIRCNRDPLPKQPAMQHLQLQRPDNNKPVVMSDCDCDSAAYQRSTHQQPLISPAVWCAISSSCCCPAVTYCVHERNPNRFGPSWIGKIGTAMHAGNAPRLFCMQQSRAASSCAIVLVDTQAVSLCAAFGPV